MPFHSFKEYQTPSLEMHARSQDGEWLTDSDDEWISPGPSSWNDSLSPVVLALFCSKILKPVNIAAMGNMGKVTFQRRLLQLVESFGKDLLAEASSSAEHRTAKMWQDTSSFETVVLMIMDQTERSRQLKSSASIARNLPSYGTAYTSKNGGFMERTFQLESKAFHRYKEKLVDMAHGPIVKRISEAIGSTVLDESGDALDPDCRGLIAAEISWVPCRLTNICEPIHYAKSASILRIERKWLTREVWWRLKGVLVISLLWIPLITGTYDLKNCFRGHEKRWTAMSRLCWLRTTWTLLWWLAMMFLTFFPARNFGQKFWKLTKAIVKIWQHSMGRRFRSFLVCCDANPVTDYVKGYLEHWTGEPWAWWPLSSRTIHLEPGFCRLEWQTPQGTVRYVYFREDRRPLVTLAFENAPKFVNLEEPFAPCERCSSGQVGNTLSIVRDTTSADSSSTQASSPGTKSASGQMTKQQQTLEDLKGIHGLDVQLPLRENRPTEHLYLCVATKDSFTACPIRTDLMRYDIDFFKELKSNYCKARGPWLRWLSPYRYHHCEFYELEKYGIDLIAPIDIGFPDEDFSYKFEPRPTKPKMPKGPISQKAFHDRFYKDKDFHFTWRGRQRCRYFYEPDSTSLRAVPKKLEPLELSDGKQEHFYGLYAVERIAFVRVLAYFALALLLGVVFFFVMFSPETRQTSNAAFLIMMIMAALAFLRNYVHDDLYSVRQ